MNRYLLIIAIAFASLLVGCKPEARVPNNARTTQEVVSIYPDYRDIVVPQHCSP